GPLVYHAPLDGVADNLKLVINGTNLQLFDNGVLQLSRPLAKTTGAFIYGADGEADTLTVDNSGGLITLASGITFDGGSGTGNVVNLTGLAGPDIFVLTPTYAIVATN